MSRLAARLPLLLALLLTAFAGITAGPAAAKHVRRARHGKHVKHVKHITKPRSATSSTFRVAPDNPLRSPWGLYQSVTSDPTNDPPSAFWNLSHDAVMRHYLDTFRFRWFGSWIKVHDTGHGATLKWGARRTAREYALQIQRRGGPDALVPVGVFRLDPFERQLIDHHQVATPAQQQEYRDWMAEFLGGLQDAHARAVIVLQPDMPLTLDLPHGSKLYLNMIKWTVGQINATLPTATTYIDAGASDWLSPQRAADMLQSAGVASVRGFSLNITHYASTADEVAYGTQVVDLLARKGIAEKHFVVSTALNGRPFTHAANKYTFQHGVLCATRQSQRCVTLGQPSTLDTGTTAADGFLWIGRSWYNNATPRTEQELRQLVATSPWL